ncbi:MAG TPA: hypothetical protein VI259_12605 [Gemmatimonadaceae bacterium]
MSYTVWQGDRLIGETDLANDRVDPRYRSGNFIPVPGTEELVPMTDSSLQLRDADGKVVPTEWVTVYDLDAEINDDEDDEADFDETLDDELAASVDHDAAVIREWMAAREAEAFDDCDDDDFCEEFSRYQIQLLLAEGAAIPD